MISKKSIFKLMIILVSFPLIFHCKSKEKDDYLEDVSYNQLEHIDKANIDKGKLFEQGYILNIKELKRIKLDTSHEGFIVLFGDIKLYQNNFYVVDRASSGINVYKLNGEYQKTINITPAPKKGCSYSNLLQTNRKTFLLKNARQSEIIEFDSLGNVQKKFVENDEKVEIAPDALDFIETETGLEVYSGIFQWQENLEDVLTKTLIVGKFDNDGKLVNQFIKHDPIYSKYNLFGFQPCCFKIWDNKLFLVEQALPYVRVFSLDGEPLYRFGTTGLHMLPIEKRPKGRMPIDRLHKFLSNHTFYDDISFINKIKGYNKPLISIVYNNPDLIEDNERETKFYLMLYTPDGEILYNDIEIPGPIFQITKDSNLLILLELAPGNFVVGLFQLEMVKGI
ncbi:MAG: hypothetical protein ACFFDN_46605 [Candidatus Hodarchaeota archaeon]